MIFLDKLPLDFSTLLQWNKTQRIAVEKLSRKVNVMAAWKQKSPVTGRG
jgi:hypothetical protein